MHKSTLGEMHYGLRWNQRALLITLVHVATPVFISLLMSEEYLMVKFMEKGKKILKLMKNQY